jgi:crossover junction endodeoxyribonuclease RuvC
VPVRRHRSGGTASQPAHPAVRGAGTVRADCAAVEQTFVNKDAVATLKLGHARAIALLVPAQAGLAVGEYAPNAVKKTVVGVGKAAKAQVDHMVRMQLPGRGSPAPMPPMRWPSRSATPSLQTAGRWQAALRAAE